MSWDDMLAQADQAVAAFFDTETFTATDYHRPANASVNAPLTTNGANLPFDLQGSIDFEPSINAFGGGSRPSADDNGPRHVTQICISALTAGWPWLPQTGDRLTRTKDGLAYSIAAFDSDGTDRVVFWVNRGR